MEDYKTIAQDELARCMTIARDRYGYDVEPFIRWNLRGLKAGEALLAEMTMRLNPAIASAEGEAYAQTVAHEFAHLLVHWRWERAIRKMIVEYVATMSIEKAVERAHRRLKQPRSHGLEWQSMMLLFGRRRDRCHQFKSATRAVERRTYLYRCACPGSAGDNPVSVIRHKRMLSGKVKYRCKRCFRHLALAGGVLPGGVSYRPESEAAAA